MHKKRILDLIFFVLYCCNLEVTDMSTQFRLSESDRLWFRYVVPTISEQYPGSWRSTLGAAIDLENGIDYIYEGEGEPRTVSARLWNSKPMQHFSMRHRRSIHPEMGLEIASRLGSIARGEQISDLTMEAFIYKRKLYMGIIDTRLLYTTIEGLVPFLSEFYVTNDSPKDLTFFKRAPFSLFPAESIQKVILPVRTGP